MSNLQLHSVESKYAYLYFVWMMSIWEIQTTISGRTKHVFSLAPQSAGIYKNNGGIHILPCGGDMAQKRLVCRVMELKYTYPAIWTLDKCSNLLTTIPKYKVPKSVAFWQDIKSLFSISAVRIPPPVMHKLKILNMSSTSLKCIIDKIQSTFYPKCSSVWPVGNFIHKRRSKTQLVILL